MTAIESLPQLLRRLYFHLSKERRIHIISAIILTLVASFAEVVSIGAILPFLAILTAPEKIFYRPEIQPIIRTLAITEPQQLMLPITVLFAVAAIVAGAIRLVVLYVTTRLSFSIGTDVSIQMFRRTLYQSYLVHITRNSSEVINGIYNKTAVVINGIMLSVMTLVNSAVMLTAIMFFLIFIQFVATVTIFIALGTIYGTIILLTRPRLLASSHSIASQGTELIKTLQEGLGGIRDILVYGSQEAYCKIYKKAEVRLRRAQYSVVVIGSAPRYIMEALGMALMAILAYALAIQKGGVEKAIPIIGAFALAAQRILPLVQQGYGAVSSLKACHVSLSDAIDFLDQPLPEHANQIAPASIPFRQSIELRKLSFRYTGDGPWVLHNLNLRINKGSRVGIVGVTGSGKSTLTDLIMGLLEPTEGCMAIDGQVITSSNCRSWQEHIAHVPQSIFLSDTTIMENIAFGIPWEDIDQERVRKACSDAKILDLIESWPRKYKTVVGERGVSLSGGQRQRVGIARALYRHADVIILDEATSSLDNETESAVMDAIDNLSKELTIVIIAHRLTTLKNCDCIIELGNKGVVANCENHLLSLQASRA